jgi:phospholipid/cholesterol/gamma-HCH transport system ATP-binding protein
MVTGDTIIRVDDFTAAYNGKVILDRLNFEVYRGEVFVILGGSGCGKSTLLKHMIGLYAPAAGTILLDGYNVTTSEGGERQRLLRKFGVMYQSGALFGSMTVLDNVCLPLQEFTDLPPDAIRLIASMKLQRVGLGGFDEHMPSELSGGMQKRAAIARAMVQRAQLVLADEPIASLDPEAARRVMESLAELNRADGVTVLVSLHQVQFAMRYCPRTVALRDGKVVFDGLSAALTPEKLGELYGAEAEELLLGEAVAPAQDPRPRKVVGFPQPAEALAVAAAG